jgi:hypothetical protein
VEDDATREELHLTMTGRNSLTLVVTDVWEKEKCARDTDDELARVHPLKDDGPKVRLRRLLL